MKDIRIKSVVAYMALLPMFFLFLSCSGNDYIATIPKNSKAVLSLDVQKLSDGKLLDKMESLLKIDDVNKCGLDLSAKIYAFETPEGNIGFSAKVADEDRLKALFDALSNDGTCQKVSEYKDFNFTVVKDAWVAGFSSGALVVMGPALPSQHMELRRQVAKYLGQDKEQGIEGSPMFGKLDSIGSPVALVAQAAVLPDKFAVPFTICAPKDADASQVMIAAELDISNEGWLTVVGESFSFNKDIDAKLKAASALFRPIEGTYVDRISANSAAGAFMNVDGEQFITLLHANKTFQALLAGMNMAVDMDNIIKSFDGDVAICLPDIKGKANACMAAELKRKSFLDDVGYWKQSCPAGSKITDWGKDAYCYTNGEMSYYFGVTPDMQFYSGSTADGARGLLAKSSTQLPAKLQDKIKGRRLAVVLNIGALLGDYDFVSDMLGGVDTVLYVMK